MIDADRNARQITQRYALEHFCQAAANRGKSPAPYNGSIFTMYICSIGVADFLKPKEKPSRSDERAWVRKYGYTLNECKVGTWQNTLYDGKVAYLHLFDMPAEGLIRLPRYGTHIHNGRYACRDR